MRAALLIVVLLSLACGDKLRSWQAPNTQPPLTFQPQERLFLIPVGITIGGERGEASRRFTEAFLAEFSAEALATAPALQQQLTDSGLLELSRGLAEAMIRGALNHNDGNYFQREDAYLNEQLGALFAQLVSQGVKVRYVAAAHISARPRAKQREQRFEVMGGIYDMEKGTTVVVVDFFLEASSAEISAQLPALGKRLASELKCPSDQRACR